MRGELSLREERPGDEAAIGACAHRGLRWPARGGALVQDLRATKALELSLVAERAGRQVQIVGHVALSAVTTPDCEAQWRGLGLAPLGVLPEEQRCGTGAALMRRALELARESGAAFVVLLGDPAFYRRFGFVPASSAGLRCVYDAPPEAFQVLEVAPERWRVEPPCAVRRGLRAFRVSAFSSRARTGRRQSRRSKATRRRRCRRHSACTRTRRARRSPRACRRVRSRCWRGCGAGICPPGSEMRSVATRPGSTTLAVTPWSALSAARLLMKPIRPISPWNRPLAPRRRAPRPRSSPGDDAPEATLLHAGNQRRGQAQRRAQVDVEHPLELHVGNTLERCIGRERGGVVHEHVDRRHGAGERSDERAVAQVAGMAERLRHPVRANRPACRRAPRSLRAVTSTRAPSSPSANAIARPMPREAPVTSAVRPQVPPWCSFS